MAAPAFGQIPLNLDDPTPAQTPTPAPPPAPVSAPTDAAAQPLADQPPAVQAASPAEPNTPATATAAPASLPHVAEWIGQRYLVPDLTEVMAEPSASSAITSHLRAGGTVEVVGVLSDPKWLEIQLPDKSTGFVLATSLPAVFGGASAAAPAAGPTALDPDHAASPPQPGLSTIRGLAYVYDSATLLVLAEGGGTEPIKVPLSSLDGFSGDPKLGLAHYLESTGAEVGCTPAPSGGYICKVGDGTDVARAALVNGVARTRPAAPSDYGVQQDAAIAARRGIWRNGAAAVAAIPMAESADSSLAPGQYVAGVPYEAGPIPQAFAAEQPVDGMAFIDGQPFTLDESIPAPVVYEEGVGWGFWDRSLKWRQAPGRWASRLERFHPRGEGVRPVELERHGFVPHDTFFRGPAMVSHAAPGPGMAAEGRGPYLPASFAPRPTASLVGRPGGGFGPPGLAPHVSQQPPGGFPRSAMAEQFQRGGPAMPGRGEHVELARPFAPGTPQHDANGTGRGFEAPPRALAGRPPGPPPMQFNRQPMMAPAVQRAAPAPMMMQRTAPPMMMQHSAPPMIVQRAPPPMMIQRMAPSPMMVAHPVSMPMARPAAPPPRPAPPAKTH